MLNPVVGMLLNTKQNTWHPILFVEAPFPGGQMQSAGAPGRLRSKGHHTEGFKDRESATLSAKSLCDQVTGKMAVEVDIPWDGDGIPAMNLLFTFANGNIVLA